MVAIAGANLGRRIELVVALGQTALSRVDTASLMSAGLGTLLDGLSIDRGVALAVLPGGGVRVEASVGLGPLTGHCEPAGEAHGRLLQLAVEAGGCLLLEGAELPALAADGLLLVDGMGVVLALTLLDDSANASGLLAISAPNDGAIDAADVGYAQAVANLLGTALARSQADDEIARLSLHDPLTGLATVP